MTLRARPVPLAVVSNFDHRLPEILEHLEIHHFFETIEIPSRHGAAKPDPVLFEAASRALGLDPAQLVYVGDDPADRLDAIAGRGLAIIDVRALESPDAIGPAVLAALDDPT